MSGRPGLRSDAIRKETGPVAVAPVNVDDGRARIDTREPEDLACANLDRDPNTLNFAGGAGGSWSGRQEERLNIEIKEEQKLGARTGLSDEVAFLRAAYPREAWQRHLDVEGLASFWLAVHQHLRGEGAQASETFSQLRAGNIEVQVFVSRFVDALNRFLGHLDGHHRLEDNFYFPRFRGLDERMAAGFDLLEADHGQIHEQIVATVNGARGLLASASRLETLAKGGEDPCQTELEILVGQLVQHLSDEEDLVIPALIKHGEHAFR
jgi:hypothetical protein